MDGATDDGTEALDEAECRALLGDRGVGRVAVSVGAVPEIFPVNYGVVGGEVVFRTGTGTKLDAARRGAVVAFEVDHTDPLYHEGWSVLVIGTAEVVSDPGTLRRLDRLPVRPWGAGDHEHVVAIRPSAVSGRRIVHRRPR